MVAFIRITFAWIFATILLIVLTSSFDFPANLFTSWPELQTAETSVCCSFLTATPRLAWRTANNLCNRQKRQTKKPMAILVHQALSFPPVVSEYKPISSNIHL
jgi:hypothetical protein